MFLEVVLLLIRKNTKLKAIHNVMNKLVPKQFVVAYTQKYKIESNSQRGRSPRPNDKSCCLYAKIQN